MFFTERKTLWSQVFFSDFLIFFFSGRVLFCFNAVDVVFDFFFRAELCFVFMSDLLSGFSMFVRSGFCFILYPMFVEFDFIPDIVLFCFHALFLFIF